MSDLIETPALTTSSTVTPGQQSENNNKSSNSIVDLTNQKIVIYNVPKYTKDQEMKKMVKEWLDGTKVEVLKTKKPPNKTWIVLTLANESMIEELMNKINDGKHLNKKGGVLRAQRAAGRNEKREREECDESSNHNKRIKQEEYVKTPDEIRDAVTPLWKMTYDDQVDVKTKNMVFKCLAKIVKEIKSKVRTLQRDKKRQQSRKNSKDSVYKWLQSQQPIHLLPISRAPKQFQYRNKSEFTFGYLHQYSDDKVGDSESGLTNENKKVVKTPAVGFMAGGWAGGVSSPTFCANIPNLHCGIATIINEFLRESPIPPYSSREHRGVWRTVTIRSSDRTKQCMIVICHAPASGGAGAKSDGSDDYSAIFESEKQRLVKMLTGKIPKSNREFSGPGTDQLDNDCNESYCDYQVSSLFFQEFDGLSNPSPQHPVQHLYGNKYVEERLLQCTFQISPGAFFQVTTEGAEILYSIVVEKLKEVTTNPKETLLFDVCCGTGTIGLTCMKEGAVGKVVGIDISEPAIRDAVINAEKNGYKASDGCTKFVASRAEKVMYNEIKSVGRDVPIVAIVDPAREGLHQDVCKALRNRKGINRIIYVSCNPTGSLVKDAGILCSPSTKKYTGRPFKITSAQPVDMFPLTDHCEMVMVFDRMSAEEAGDEDAPADNEEVTETVTENPNKITDGKETNNKDSTESSSRSEIENQENQ